MDINIKDMLPNIFGQRTKKRKMKVNEAFEYLIQEEEQRLIDMEQVTRTAIDRVENSGIIFLDEIDKIAGREGGHGPTFRAKAYSATSFRSSKAPPSTRATAWSAPTTSCSSPRAHSTSRSRATSSRTARPLPIRVELQSLTMEDFVRILTNRSRR